MNKFRNFSSIIFEITVCKFPELISVVADVKFARISLLINTTSVLINHDAQCNINCSFFAKRNVEAKCGSEAVIRAPTGTAALFRRPTWRGKKPPEAARLCNAANASTSLSSNFNLRKFCIGFNSDYDLMYFNLGDFDDM